ncbi:MAG: hypothetical protein R3C25_02630 [Hyphomonadaceae bacterium]
MLMYLWVAVMVQAFAPGGDRIAAYASGAFESHLRAEIEAPAVIGAAGHIARYTPLTARAR